MRVDPKPYLYPPQTVGHALFVLLAILLALVLPVQAAEPPKSAGPYVPSPQSVVSDMLKLADVGPKDFVIDLGSGDGRIVLTAAKVFGARGFGVEIKDDLVKLSNEAAQRDGLSDRVKFMKQDLFKTDISPATVVTMYLLPHTVNQLQEKLLAELKPGARVVSHDYSLAGWLPHKTLVMELEEKVAISGIERTTIYLYVIPARVAGHWSAQVPQTLSKNTMRLELTQQLTRVAGTAWLDGISVPLADTQLVGDDLSFRLAGRKAVFRGKVSGKTIEGTVQTGGASAPWRATFNS